MRIKYLENKKLSFSKMKRKIKKTLRPMKIFSMRNTVSKVCKILSVMYFVLSADIVLCLMTQTHVSTTLCKLVKGSQYLYFSVSSDLEGFLCQV